MPYNDYSDVVTVCGLKGAEATLEDELDEFIPRADKAIIERITIKVRNEVPYGNVDGVNKMFALAHYPLADTNADSTVLGYEANICTSANADFHVYLWTDADDKSTRTEVEIDNSKTRIEDGVIFLKNAPPINVYESLTISYSFYPNDLDFTVLKMEAALYTGYLFLLSKYSLYPRRLRLGSFTVDFSNRGAGGRSGNDAPGLPYERILHEFERNWHLVFKKPFRKIVRPEDRWADVHAAYEMEIDDKEQCKVVEPLGSPEAIPQ